MDMLPTIKARTEITAYARSLGFDLVSFTKAAVDQKYRDAFQEWRAMKYEGGMSYMSDTAKVEQRLDMTKILPGANSVIVVAMNYYRPQPPLKRGHGRVARYAYGRDYHKIIGSKLRELASLAKTLC